MRCERGGDDPRRYQHADYAEDSQEWAPLPPHAEHTTRGARYTTGCWRAAHSGPFANTSACRSRFSRPVSARGSSSGSPCRTCIRSRSASAGGSTIRAPGRGRAQGPEGGRRAGRSNSAWAQGAGVAGGEDGAGGAGGPGI